MSDGDGDVVVNVFDGRQAQQTPSGGHQTILILSSCPLFLPGGSASSSPLR